MFKRSVLHSLPFFFLDDSPAQSSSIELPFLCPSLCLQLARNLHALHLGPVDVVLPSHPVSHHPSKQVEATSAANLTMIYLFCSGIKSFARARPFVAASAVRRIARPAPSRSPLATRFASTSSVGDGKIYQVRRLSSARSRRQNASRPSGLPTRHPTLRLKPELLTKYTSLGHRCRRRRSVSTYSLFTSRRC